MGGEKRANPAPGFIAHPDYELFFEDRLGRVRAFIGDATIAESERCLILFEGIYAPVTFFPRRDVDMSLLTRVEHTLYCSYKGLASYWDVQVADRFLPRTAWSYESPFDEIEELKDHIAFDERWIDVRLEELTPASLFPPPD